MDLDAEQLKPSQPPPAFAREPSGIRQTWTAIDCSSRSRNGTADTTSAIGIESGDLRDRDGGRPVVRSDSAP
jgi:hypothetical protein